MQIVSIQLKWNGSSDLGTFPRAAHFLGSANSMKMAGSAPARGCYGAPRLPSAREGVKIWNEGFPSGNWMMTSRSLCSASSSTAELNNIPDQSHISVQTNTELHGEDWGLFSGLEGDWLFCQMHSFGFGYFALCETRRNFSLVSATLSRPFWCTAWSASPAHLEVSCNRHTTIGKSRTWETSSVSRAVFSCED